MPHALALAGFVFFLAFCQASPALAAAPTTLTRISVGGSQYTSLSGWATLCGLKGRYDRRSGLIEFSNQATRLSFTANSRKAEINGATILLSLPVVLAGERPLISIVDLHTALQPLLYPAKKTNYRVRTVCLDPGHGGKDPGNISGSSQEKQYTLLLAQEVGALLRANNIKTVMTRESDRAVDRSARPAFAQSRGADLFVSLHYNSAANQAVRGVEVFCLTPPGVASSNDGGGVSRAGADVGNIQNASNVILAYCVQKAISQGTGIQDLALKRSRFEVLREASMPAVLVEGGFMTNPADFKKIKDPVSRKKMAQAIVNGILSYKRTVERP